MFEKYPKKKKYEYQPLTDIVIFELYNSHCFASVALQSYYRCPKVVNTFIAKLLWVLNLDCKVTAQ